MFSIYDEGMSTIADRFTRILKSKIYKKMTAPDSKSYLNYLDKFVNKYNKTYIALLVRNLYLLTNLL